MTIKDRIDKVRKSLNLSYSTLIDDEAIITSDALRLNVSRESDKLKDFLLPLISKKHNISEHWLLTGEGEMFSTIEEPNAIPISYSEMNVMMVPLISTYAQAGYLSGFNDPEYIEELPKIPFADDKEHRGDYLCFEVKGDSMEDGTIESILEGDLLLCRNVRQDYWRSKLHINKWDFVIVHREKGILVKRIIKHDVESGTLTLHSLNDYYEDFTINLKDVAKIMNVVDIKRKHKRR